MITALQIPDSITLLAAIFGLGFLFVLWWVLEGKDGEEEDAYYERQKWSDYTSPATEPISHVRLVDGADHNDGLGVDG